MGITLDEFYEKMYEESVTGDWTVFGDEAKELNWVQNVAEVVIEESINRRPEDPSPTISGCSLVPNKDHDERVRLPRLRAMDGYFIYNRDSRFYIAD